VKRAKDIDDCENDGKRHKKQLKDFDGMT